MILMLAALLPLLLRLLSHSADFDALECEEWLSQVSGEGDFVLCCDGRIRSTRRYIEDKLEAGGKSPQELFIFYVSDEGGAGNKIFMGARMHEVAYVKLPCKRTRVTVQPRSDEFLPKGRHHSLPDVRKRDVAVGDSIATHIRCGESHCVGTE